MFIFRVHAKGNLVNIPERRLHVWREIARQRNETATQQHENREESSFLFNQVTISLHIPESPLRREWVKPWAKRLLLFVGVAFGDLMMLLENRRVYPLWRFSRRAGVLKTASGFQGE